MKLDNEKIDSAVLALLLLGRHDGARAWKGFDWDSMNRLHEKGFISDPRGKAKSIVFTEEGLQEAERLLEELFSQDAPADAGLPSEHVYAIVPASAEGKGGGTMGVTFQALRPMLRTNDLRGTVEFWTDRLGFTCDGLSEEDGWASLSRDGVGLMIATPNAHAPFKTASFTGSFYFNVDDVAALWADLKDRAKIVYPMEEFHYGMREFAIYDNNGYMLQFGTPLRS